MPVINILSPHVADMIAAGEVVERPASVIKELMENAFDAGAKNVSVEIRGGGATYIRVTDDGCGMAPEDAGVAFLRHATSKLRDEKGLEAISTMGFRGEALAAISAVSNIELRTRRRDDAEGTLVRLQAGDITDMVPAGCPAGTSMIVRDLFFNTPARLKFLKSDRSEASACLLSALRCALGRPEISVRFIRDGREEFFSPGDGREDSCVYALLGRELASSMLPCMSEDRGLKLRGFISSPAAGRGNRSNQYFFCNGRYIKSPLLQSALEQAYKNSLLTGRYPSCALYLELGLGSVDVNVHPAKTEVKFSAERQVFDLVYHAARFALESENRTAVKPPVSAPLAPPRPAPAPAERGAARESGASVHCDTRAAGPGGAVRSVRSAAPEPPRESALNEPAPASFRSYDLPYQTSIPLPARPISASFGVKSPAATGLAAQAPKIDVENSVQNVESSPFPDHKIVGEALKTYIIVERGEELIFIDKHAAHERIIFDRLKAQGGRMMAQNLLCPSPLRLTPEDGELLEKNGELLTALGFEIEAFGENEFIIRAVPADMAPGDAAAALEEICEKLRGGRSPEAENARDEILHTVACKAAIKAGWDTQRQELERLVEAVLSGEVKYCPHGRPVSVAMTRKELDKQFKRIV